MMMVSNTRERVIVKPGSKMIDAAPADPTGRFTGFAEVYARHRPDYPPLALAYLLRHCGLKPGDPVVDVGCGTGISARQLAGLGLVVTGIEPNADMRAEAERTPAPPGAPPPAYRAGRAEATGLASGSTAAVFAAQAFHWFDPEPTLAEFHRLLKPGGWVALLWNERDETDAVTRAYGAVVRSTHEAAQVEASRRHGGKPLLASPLFRAGQRVKFVHQQTLDEEGLIGRALSVSYAPKQDADIARYVAELRAVFGRFHQGGQVVLRYRTTLVLAQKPAG